MLAKWLWLVKCRQRSSHTFSLTKIRKTHGKSVKKEVAFE